MLLTLAIVLFVLWALGAFAFHVGGGLILPVGGEHALHKGFGLALVVDALAGVLTGASFARQAGDA